LGLSYSHISFGLAPQLPSDGDTDSVG
jgi:hypothetical protein